jgi:thiamine-monophosphate kinase
VGFLDGHTLADVGEFGLIARITAILAGRQVPGGVELGPGDDAAVVALGADPRVVATTDMLVEGRHFRCDWSSAYDIGRKAAAQNLADVEAMGARPVALLVAFGAPGTTTVSFAEDVARGIADEAVQAGATVAGGDVVSSERVTLAVTALGALDGRPPVTRSGARPGDVVRVAGRLGWSAAGLALLQRGEPVLLERHAELADFHRAPQPPYGAGVLAAQAGATAMIDVSDGLAADLQHVLDASGAGAEIDLTAWGDDALGAAASDLGTDVRHWLRSGGEEHALLITAPLAAVGVPGRAIGRVIAGAGVVWADGELAGAAGFDHFGGVS